jgi:hypothetical protein
VRAKSSLHENFWLFRNGILIDSDTSTAPGWNASVSGTTVTIHDDGSSGSVAWFASADVYGNAGAGGGGGSVADDIAKHAGGAIDRVRGFRAVPLGGSDGDTPPIGGTWTYNEVATASFKAKKPVPPGHYDLVDFGGIADWKSGVTATTSSSSPVVTVTDSSGFHAGDKIAIDGVTGTRTVLSVGGPTSLTLTANAGASVVGSDIYHDNYDAFVATLAYLLADKNAVRKVVASGWFFIGQQVTIAQTIHLEGSGDVRATINATGPGERSSPGTWFIFPKDVTGFRLKAPHASDPGGHTQSAERTRLRNFAITCNDGTTTSGHGIYSSIEFIAEAVTIENMGGNGFYLFASAGDGNVDLSVLDNCYAKNCHDGFHIEGSEANVCRVIACNAFVNRNVGFYDLSGNGGTTTYVGCHASGNATFNYQTDGTYNGSALINCYNEDVNNCSFVSGTGIWNGTVAESSTSDAFEIRGGQMTRAPILYRNSRGARVVESIMGETTSGTSMQLAKLVIFEDDDISIRSSIAFMFNSDADPWWTWKVNGSDNYDMMRYPTHIYERSPGPWFPNGLYLGRDNDVHVVLQAGTDVADRRRGGTPITYEVGDSVKNAVPTEGDWIEKRCIDAGTIDGASVFSGTATTNGSADVVLSSSTGIEIGQHLNISGVGNGPHKITGNPATNTWTVTPTPDTTVGPGASVTFATPIFETVLNPTPPAHSMVALDVDWSLSSVFYKSLASGANTITFSNVRNGKSIDVRVTANGGGSTVTWPSTMKWVSGTPPTFGAGETHVIHIVSDGIAVYGISHGPFSEHDFPASLNPTAYLRDFTGLPWNGTASGGSSGSHDFDGSSASLGPDFGLHPSADLTPGSNNYLQDNTDTVDDLINASAFTLQWIISFDAFSASDSSPDNEPALFVDGVNGYFRVTASASGVRTCIFGGTNTGYNGPLSTATKYCIQTKYDGTTVKIRVNGGTWTTATSTNISNLTARPRIGTNISANKFIDGQLAQFIAWDSTLSDGNLDALYADAQANYGV